MRNIIVNVCSCNVIDFVTFIEKKIYCTLSTFYYKHLYHTTYLFLYIVSHEVLQFVILLELISKSSHLAIVLIVIERNMLLPYLFEAGFHER